LGTKNQVLGAGSNSLISSGNYKFRLLNTTMDIAEDFKFLDDNLATNFNPFYEGEYLVIQTYPREKSLIVDKRSFNHKEAKDYCSIQNLAHDYTSFGLRIIHHQKLWEVNFLGEPSEVSDQQDWKIHEDYFKADYDENIDGEIVLCQCSYPYFSSLRTFTNNYGEGDEYWQSVTCLVEDNGRDIDNCPNCNCALIKLDENEDEEDDNYDDFIPSACRGCSNYDGEFYGYNQLICAIHPYGWNDENCPDFSG
jgi:hypothetical protein